MAEDIYVLIREGDLPQLYRLSYKGVRAYLKRQQFKGKDGSSVVWKGAWSSSTSYSPLDMVSYNGQSYISIKLGTNKDPVSRTDYWDVMAVKGTSGEGINWQGAWDSGTTYVENDAVSNDGSSYICILESTNNEPPNATYWDILAEAGTGSGDITKDELAGGSLVTTIADSEHIPISVSGSPNSIKKIVWTAFRTLLDGIYALTGHNHDSAYTAKNTAITAGTNTKITYDVKGLVTSGAAATQDDIGDGSTNKQYSATDKSKLAGIEASADVTDLTNVSSSINGASAVTPVDADKFPFVDADDNTIKTVTGANLKSYIGAVGSGDITKDELAAGTTVTDITSGAYVAITRPGTPNTIEKITKASLTTLFATDVGAAIDGAGELTTLASDDKIAVWDESASALKYITEANRKLMDNPVGTVKMYDNSTSDPNTLIGGTWARIDGPAFPGMYKSGDADMGTPMGTFGSNTKNLQHSHTVTIGAVLNKTLGASPDQNVSSPTGNGLSTTQDVLNAGITLCFWRRTA